MGNTLSNEAAYAMNLATQKHLLDLNSAGFQDFTGQNKIVSQLSETYFFSSQDSHLKMIQKVFMKKLDEAKLKIVLKNLEYINSSIVLSSYPYFLLSLPEKKNLDLSIVYRQHLHFTLEEKIAVGTYLGQQEKIYIAYQILMCGILLHELKLFHGNLSSSNVLLTSDTIAYLTDFAPYKPLYLDESQYNNIILFYPQVIEKCYFAPEKVNAEKSKVVYEYDKLTATELLDLQRMDIFSIGCIFAEIFTDSNPLFTYETLLQYSKGDKTALEKLNLITNPRIREMVTKMISLEPKGRDSLMDYFPIFKEFMPPGLFEAYTYLNYSIRRSEFSHPDVKLGLIRMIAPYLIDTLAKTATNENRQVIDSKLLSAQFIRCFPYNISKTAILFQFKSMLTTSILKSFVDPKDLTNFIDETMEQIRQKEVTVGSIDRQSAIFLDRVAHLKESKLNLNTVSYEGKSELEEEECPVKFEMKHEFEKIIKNSIKSQADIEKFDNMFIFAHLIETICSLIRSFQLSQSYLVALELLDVLSLFAKSEQILTLIIPYLQNKISERKDNLAIFYSINLLCKLVRRIEYIPKELAKDAGYNTYIKSILQSYSGDTSSVNNQIDKSFKYQIFRNIGNFIYLRLIFSVLNMKNKLEEKMKRESQFRSGEDHIKYVVDQLLEEPDCKDYSQLTDIFFFVDLIKANYSNNAGARELVKTLPEISGFFQQDTLVEFIQLTFAIYKEKKDTTFRNEAVYSIGRIIPLLNNKYEDMLTMMKELLLYAVDYTEIASIIKAFTSIIQVLPQITIITKSTILYAIIPMVGHPCSLVHNNVLKFIKLLFSQASYEEIYLVISPILTEFARLQDKKDKNMSDQIPILDFDTFLLAKNEPLSYSKYRTLQDAVTRSTDSVKMSSIETYIFNYLTNISNKGSKRTFSADKNSISLKKREFKMKRNIHSFIHEVLGSLALYQNFQSKENEFDKFKESLKEPLKLANGKTADDVKNGTVLLQKIISEALNSVENSGYSFYPVWTNKPESYKRILEFKEQYIDVIGVVRDEYKFLKHFNFNVLKLCMNYIQMIIHQTKLNEVVEGPRAMKSLDDDYLNRLKRWKPTGTLLTSINSHEGVVKSLAQINGNVFVSGGHDGHLKYHSLPTLMRNFIHSQVLDIDLNRVIDPESTDPISQKKPLKINQVHYMKNINKLAVVTNSEYLIINQEGKPDVNYKFKCNSRITAATIYGQDEYSNCVACVNTGCEFVLWDLRKKTPALVCNLSKLRGVPSSICRVDGKNKNMIGTYKGYLLCHDIRTNLTMKTSRLIFDKKLVPIVSCTEFVPNTKYNTISEDSELVALTYPSKCNQFSIFDINYSKQQENPRIHFECKSETKNTKPIEFPTLEDVSQVETILDYDAICNEHFEYLNQIYLKENNTFGLGELFNFRSVDSIVSLYTDKFDKTKLKIKEECMKNFQDVMQALSSMGENNQTLNKFISLPSERVSTQENLIDNIILTGGTDRNIRFMSLGNDFEKVDQMCSEFSTMNSYHVSNMDNQPRSFRYVYSKDMLILKEVSGAVGQSQYTFNDIVGEGQHSIKNPKNGLSYYHNCFLSQRKTADTLPGHSAAINDMIVMDTKDVREQRENRDALLLLSCGDDGSIKVWA